jgi:hypothetical protein
MCATLRFVTGEMSVSVAHNSRQNHLLAALPPEDFDRVSSHLELVPYLLLRYTQAYVRYRTDRAAGCVYNV